MSTTLDSLPVEGSGSVAGWGRRILALCADWVIASLVASSVVRQPLWGGGNELTVAQLLIFFVMTAVLVGLAGASIGHRVCGLQVVRNDGNTVLPGPIGLLRGIARAGLICLVIPALVYDTHRRGLHDRAVGTLVVRR